jgi:hypothetical protein
MEKPPIVTGAIGAAPAPEQMSAFSPAENRVVRGKELLIKPPVIIGSVAASAISCEAALVRLLRFPAAHCAGMMA